MNYPVTLSVKVFSLPTQKIISADACDLILYPDRIESITKFTYKNLEPAEDPMLPAIESEEMKCDSVLSYWKTVIAGVECFYHVRTKKWQVLMPLPGVSDNLYVWFNSKSAAMLLADILKKWLYEDTLDQELIERFTGKTSSSIPDNS